MRDAWRKLKADHPELVRDVADGRRFVWLGSGISLDQVPGLVELISRVLVFLRDKALSSDPDASDHEAALRQILIEHLPEELSKFENDQNVWLPEQQLLDSLRTIYSDVLSIGVVGKPSDYLLMEGARLGELYGDPSLEPGPTHVLLAILISEGSIAHLASGNWDGLVEKALASISSDDSLLDVYVDVNDPREGHGNAELAKFHGCAVLARNDPDKYRAKIIATAGQIANLQGDPDFQHMRDRLLELTTRLRSLVLGLSVQDSDLLTVFKSSASRSRWLWEDAHPAYLFAEPTILPGQRNVLEVAYGASYSNERPAIESRSILGSYAGPVVAALVIEVLVDKFQTALRRHGELPADILVILEQGVRRFALRVVAGYGRHESTLSEFLVEGYADFMRTFFGTQVVGNATYVPFVRGTRSQIERGHAVLGLGADRLSVLVGVLGSGELERRWRVRLHDKNRASRILLARGTTLDGVTVVGVRGAREAISVMGSEDWIRGGGQMVILQMEGGPSTSRRSPGGRIGKGRRARSRREVDWAGISEAVATHDELLVRFETGVLL